jgi:hypothetical protein
VRPFLVELVEIGEVVRLASCQSKNGQLLARKGNRTDPLAAWELASRLRQKIPPYDIRLATELRERKEVFEIAQAQSRLLRLDQHHLRPVARVSAAHKLRRLRHLMRVLLVTRPVADKCFLGADHLGGARVRIARGVGVLVQLDGDGVKLLQRGDLAYN